MKFSGAQLVIRLLERQGIEIITGIPGGANLPLYHALGNSNIRHILARHEQGAGFMAQGMARSTGRPAVCFATSGPGATNLVTPMADAFLDSIPMVAVTGQTPLTLMGTDAFQEVDTYGLSLPVSKHSFLVRSVEELITVIPRAFEIAVSGRPGPVWVDIPKDVQTAEADVDAWPGPGEKQPGPDPDKGTLDRAVAMIQEARKPVFYAGGGIVRAGAGNRVAQLCEKNGIPLVTTLMGLGIGGPSGTPAALGMLGMHGERSTNLILDQCDLLIAAGVRFDDRATGKIEAFCPRARVIHMDIDNAEIGKLKTSHCGIYGDAGQVLEALIPLVETRERADWKAGIAEIQRKHPGPGFFRDSQRPEYLIRRVGRYAVPGSFIVTDVGQHQMWTAQAFPFSRPGQLITSGGLGTMGFGLPAAIGTALACPDAQVICITGDGSVLMNIQEMATLVEQGLNLKIILLNNQALGLVRQQQELFFQGNYVACQYSQSPDFTAIAKGFGIPAQTLGSGESPDTALASLFNTPGPGLVHIPIDPRANVEPMVPPGAANLEMIGGENQ